MYYLINLSDHFILKNRIKNKCSIMIPNDITKTFFYFKQNFEFSLTFNFDGSIRELIQL